MPARSPSLPARYVAPLAEYVESLGPDWRELLQRASLDAELFASPDAALTLDELDRLIGGIERATGRQDVGFEIGRRIEVASHGAIGEAMLRCATIDQAIQLASRYFPLVTPAFTMEYRRRGREARISFHPVVAMTRDVLRTMNEVHAVSVHYQLVAQVGARLGRYDVFLPMAAPPHARRYRELAPARFHFAPMPLPEVRFILDAALMDLPLASAPPRSGANDERHLHTLLPRTSNAGSWSDWVALMLREAEDCQPTLEQLAGLLSVAPYTLARALAKEGNTYRELSNRVRFERARNLLREPRNAISHIAYRLGYSSVANFSTAFRRAYGTSPRAYRLAASTAAN